ncbi:15144_t:CDS:2 [Racocetra fulgida]|uniref:15144_t:CDS:1 n=1 Tax=Racocetra fulgida TaxID=60492 RepID=A0A9N9F277_9GLOM|nr:15144_t:CDS:2 [Racocetra fulgida]
MSDQGEITPEEGGINKQAFTTCAKCGLMILAAQIDEGPGSDDVTPEKLKQQQKAIEEKVYNIWTVLSAFEEMSAACISDMLLHVSNGAYLEGVKMIERFINHVDILFSAIDDLEVQLVQASGQEGKQVIEPNADNEITSDLCHVCRITVEEECYKYGHYRWHIGCLRCSGCSRELRTIYRDATFNQITEMTFCPAHTNEQAAPGFQYVTQLEQYTYLLRVELSRMYNLLKRKDEHSLSDYDDIRSGRKTNKEEAGLIRKDSRSKSYSSGDKSYVSLNTDIKRMKSVLDRKVSTSERIAKTSRVVEHEQPNTSQTQEETSKDKLARAPSQHHVRIIDDKMPDSQNGDARLKFDLENEAITLADISAIAAAEMSTEEKPKKKFKRVSRTKLYMSELSGLEYFIVRHVAVLIMEPYVKDYFNLEELLDLIGSKKATLWTKFVQQIRPKEVPVKKKEVLVERYGVDSVLGAGPGRIRVPSFIDDSISAMKTMDMSVEGIFRKNGNIRRLKDLSEAIDRNPSSVNLSEDNPVQVAALMKKFLRDLPDPLLTFNLLKYQDDFWVVPEDLAAALRDQELINNPERLTPKDIMKRCENLVKLQKSQPQTNNYANSNSDEISSDGDYTFVQVPDNHPYQKQADQRGESNRDDSNLHGSSSSLVNEVSIPVEQRAS